jgi:hypothetical protein
MLYEQGCCLESRIVWFFLRQFGVGGLFCPLWDKGSYGWRHIILYE